MFDCNKSKYLNKLMKLEIRCFQHCETRSIYLCLDMPDQCPSCKSSLSSTKAQFRIPPFLLPRPLILSSCVNPPPFSLVLQLSDENILAGDLHIGVTNSKSKIFDFNANGMNRNSPRWFDMTAMVIRMDESCKKPSSLLRNEKIRNDAWDFYLDQYWEDRELCLKWNSSQYDEKRLNCLDFVTDFLLNYDLFNKNSLLNSLRGINLADNMAGKSDGTDVSSRQEKLTKLKKCLKQKLLDELIEPEYSKFAKYANLVFELNEKKFLREEINFFN